MKTDPKTTGKQTEGYEVECCEEHILHEDRINLVAGEMPSEEELTGLAELYKAFGDYTRIRVLFALSGGEICVCDLAEALHMTQSAISHQLRILKQSKLIRARRDGKQVFYSLADNHVKTMIDQGIEHVRE